MTDRTSVRQLTSSTHQWPLWSGPDGGSGCENPDCGAGPRDLRVFSVLEFSLVYPTKSRQREVAGYTAEELSDSGVEYICEFCGQKYRAMNQPL